MSEQVSSSYLFSQTRAENSDEAGVEVSSNGGFEVWVSGQELRPERTLQDFQDLHRGLKSENPDLLLPALPLKSSERLRHLKGSAENALAFQLSVFLRKIESANRVSSQEEFKSFVGAKVFSIQRDGVKEMAKSVVKSAWFNFEKLRGKKPHSELYSDSILRTEKGLTEALITLEATKRLAQQLVNANNVQISSLESGATLIKDCSKALSEFFEGQKDSPEFTGPFGETVEIFFSKTSELNKFAWSIESIEDDLAEAIATLKEFIVYKEKVLEPRISKLKQSGLPSDFIDEELRNYKTQLEDLTLQAASLHFATSSDLVSLSSAFNGKFRECFEHSARLWTPKTELSA